jgi:uncharacterized protein YecE (DUF72 family)
VEFRNRAWFEGGEGPRTLQFLEGHDIPFVMVDAPPGTDSSVPPMLAVTSPSLAVVRFHGRRTDTWEKPGAGVSEKFKYLYDTQELQEWAPRTIEAASAAREVHVVFNNCYANYGTTNALEFVDMLRARLGTPAA